MSGSGLPAQPVDATLYPETERWGLWRCVEDIFEAFRRERDLSVYSQAYLNKVARQLNEQPRPRNSKPQQGFNASVASTD
jgi:hypothetical protein